jgi:hypothetical protein
MLTEIGCGAQRLGLWIIGQVDRLSDDADVTQGGVMHCAGDAEVLRLRFREHAFDVVDRSAGDTGLVDCRQPVRAGFLPGDRADPFVETPAVF